MEWTGWGEEESSLPPERVIGQKLNYGYYLTCILIFYEGNLDSESSKSFSNSNFNEFR